MLEKAKNDNWTFKTGRGQDRGERCWELRRCMHAWLADSCHQAAALSFQNG